MNDIGDSFAYWSISTAPNFVRVGPHPGIQQLERKQPDILELLHPRGRGERVEVDDGEGASFGTTARPESSSVEQRLITIDAED